MSGLCLRCDWEGQGGGTCPRCGTPLYRRVDAPEPRRAAARTPPGPATGIRPTAGPEPAADGHQRAPAPIRSATSLRAVVAVAVIAFGLVGALLVAGAPRPRPTDAATSPSPAGLTNGILVYAAPAGEGAARLWLWDLTADVVRRGPLVPEPLGLHTVGSPGYGWVGITADAGDGRGEAVVLDSLERDARGRTIGTADVVTWTREGRSVVLVERRALRDGCRRRITIDAVHVDADGSEDLLDAAVCGDVPSVGRTSLGYFATRQRPGGADVIGLGYRDAGVVLADHALVGISPGGEMLVTPASSLGSGSAPAGSDPPPVDVRGPALLFDQFGGLPHRYLVEGAPFVVDRVLAYSPGSLEALVLGRRSGGEAGVWSIPLRPDERGRLEPIRLGPADGFTAASYAADGTAFVLTAVRLWVVRDERLMPIDLPPTAPVPLGPIVWVLREPLTQL